MAAGIRSSRARRTRVSRSVPAGLAIEAAEIRAPDTARDNVVPGRVVKGDEGRAWLGHAGLLPWNLGCGKATGAAAGVQAEWASRSFPRSGLGCAGFDFAAYAGGRLDLREAKFVFRL